MALQCAWNNDGTGDTYTSAYHKVSEISFDYLRASATVLVRVYRNVDARLASKLPVFKCSFTLAGSDFATYLNIVTLNANNPLRQVYQFLKTRPEYAGAVDV